MNIPNIPLVYIAGPFSASTREGVEANIAAAVQVGLDVASLGACPVVPHSNTAHPEFEQLQGYEFWIAATAKLLTRCDALITTSNWEGSSGARGEVKLATERGIPVFHSLNVLNEWLSLVWDTPAQPLGADARADLDLAKEVIGRLNRLLRLDVTGAVRPALSRLLNQRVDVALSVRVHPTLQVTPDSKLGPLGLINGLVGVIPSGTWAGWGYIAAEFDDEGLVRCFLLTSEAGL